MSRVTRRDAERHSGLGRGLGALIPQRPAGAAGRSRSRSPGSARNPYQPRQRVEQEALETLAASIASHGVLQPILVTEIARRLPARRRRAARPGRAARRPRPHPGRRPAARPTGTSWSSPSSRTSSAPTSNADRGGARLPPARRRVRADPGRVAQRASAGPAPRVANTLRLLDLEPAVQDAVADGHISEGHARALGRPRPGRSSAAARGGRRRGTCRSARPRSSSAGSATGPGRSRRGQPSRDADPDLERVEEDLRAALGTKVTPRPVEQGRPDRDRVLQRRGALGGSTSA